MNDKLHESIKLVQEYCQSRECNDACEFHDLTVYHNCRLMSGIPCNWTIPEDVNNRQ
jgi:hypothetical protein